MNIHSIAWFRHDASGYESPRAGTSQGIFFANFMPTLVRAHYAVWGKDYQLRIHHDERVRDYPYFKAIERMHRAGLLRLMPCGEAKTLCGSMLWRLNPLFDPTTATEWIVSRDIDSLPMHRDRVMVEEAIEAKAIAHAILDSESHSGPLMGGMTAFYAPRLKAACKLGNFTTLDDFLAKSPREINFNQHGADQKFLKSVVWPHVCKQMLIHQRREDVAYPEVLSTRPVAPQTTELDKVVRHIGAGYPRERANEVLNSFHRYATLGGYFPLEMMETLEWPARGQSAEMTGAPNEPWYTRQAINFLEKTLAPSMRVLEFGGGASTCWYADRVAHVVCIENDPLWRVMIESNTKHKVSMFALTPFPITGQYDLVAIDGGERLKAIEMSRDAVKRGGWLLLDNSDEPSLQHAFYLLNKWPNVTYPNGMWHTTIWRRP